jgi:hypothetical protein
MAHIALAMLIAGTAGSAGAQITQVTSDVTTPQTWCDDEAEMFLTRPIFVSSKLTILPGCIVRGNPRTEQFDAQNPTVGAPGTLLISQDGFLDAQGSALNPIIMTTGASDANNDGIPDDDNVNGFPDGWNGSDPFLDNTPKTNPLAPLDRAGNQTAGLWGGLVILGRAPTNLGENLVLGYGKAIIEGLGASGFPAGGATYGGFEPHDSSGIIRYVSIRHAGDEIGEGNELNGVTLGGVGDGTIFEFVEVYANQDDGMEWFGGTMNGRNLANVIIGDDSLDIDQGFSGNLQNLLVAQTFFHTNNFDTQQPPQPIAFGAASGDNAGEWDGDDCDPCNIQVDSISGGDVSMYRYDGTGGPGNFISTSWPNAHPAIYNLTVLGAFDEDGNNPAVNPTTGSRGLRMRDGWTGAVLNTIINNSAGTACAVENDAGSHTTPEENPSSTNPDIIRLVSTTIADSGAPNANCANFAIPAGDAAVAAGEYDGGTANATSVSGEILVNDNYFFTPDGVVSGGRGKLLGSKVGAKADPRPANPTDANVSGGVRPRGAGLDASATYRGGFPASQPLWTDGWTTLYLGEIL